MNPIVKGIVSAILFMLGIGLWIVAGIWFLAATMSPYGVSSLISCMPLVFMVAGIGFFALGIYLLIKGK